MKLTLEIPQEVLEECRRLTGASTIQEAVVTAIIEHNRRQRRELLAAELGTFDAVMEPEELLRHRESG